ncbi:MAG: ferritin family protein, partial [Clostridia bacterium]
EYAEVSEAFHEINIVEMHHLEIFGELAYKLGENPRLWSQRGIQKKYWSPCYNRYPVQIHSILENSLSGELMAIKKYEMQCRAIANTNITDILKRIIADEEVHVEIFKKLIEKY